VPAKDQLDPDSLRSRARVWLALHPGWHPSRAVAAGLELDRPAQRTALVRELNRLAAKNEGAASYRDSALPARGPGTLYAQAGTAPPVRSEA
jgi:hypothetical protein